MKITSKLQNAALGIKNFAQKRVVQFQKHRLEHLALKPQPKVDTFVNSQKSNKKLVKAIFSGLKDIGIEPLKKTPYISPNNKYSDYISINGKYFDAIDFMLALGYKSDETDKIISNIAQLSDQSDSVKVFGQVTKFAPLNSQLYEVFDKITKK